MRRLLKMDESVLAEHAALGCADDCYFLLEYLPGQRYGYSWENDAIRHLKRRIDRSHGIALKRKLWAINELGDLLRPALREVVDLGSTTIVPVPPSRVCGDRFYDDRVMQVLRRACTSAAAAASAAAPSSAASAAAASAFAAPSFGASAASSATSAAAASPSSSPVFDADIRELIVCREGRAAAHESERRPSVEELFGNFRLGGLDGGPVPGAAAAGPVRERIVLFDDVITSGNHFVACKRFLLTHFPGREVVGVFLARRRIA